MRTELAGFYPAFKRLRNVPYAPLYTMRINGSDNLTAKEKAALAKLITGLKNLYGANLDGVILYGSKARGDATRNSDIDVMVILKEYDNWSAEFDKVAGLGYAVEEEYDYALLLSFIIKKKEEYRVRQTPLLLNVRKEGVNLWTRQAA